MVQEFKPRVNTRSTLAVEVNGNTYIGLFCLALYGYTALLATQELGNFGPTIGSKHTRIGIRQGAHLLHASFVGSVKNSLCTKILCKLHVGQAVTNHKTSREVVLARHILAEHSCTGLAGRLVIAFICYIY